MKLLLIITALLVVGLLDATEPDLTSDYSLTPFERCISAYGGSDRVKECGVLR